MTQHTHPALIHRPVPRSSWHPYATTVLTTIVLVAAVVAVVAVVMAASSYVTSFEPGRLPSPTPAGY